MQTVKLLAKVLYHLTRILAVIYSAVGLYAVIVILLYKLTSSASVPINIADQKFTIYLPFSKIPFLLGDYASYYLLPMLLLVCFYSIFFWLLSGVFSAFKQAKLFVPKGIVQLSRFYKSNLIIPAIILIVSIICNYGVGDMITLTFLHMVLGVFAFFMAVMFKQGLLLQEEQDLTL
jgi:hypothetical protein